jgi:hypothetical protein
VVGVIIEGQVHVVFVNLVCPTVLALAVFLVLICKCFGSLVKWQDALISTHLKKTSFDF